MGKRDSIAGIDRMCSAPGGNMRSAAGVTAKAIGREQETSMLRARAHPNTWHNDMETAIVVGTSNGSSECERNNGTNENRNEKCRLNNSISTGAAAASARYANNNNLNHHNNRNRKTSYNSCNSKNCDFFNFVTVLCAMFMVVSVHFSSALIELQNDKEKYGKCACCCLYSSE